MPSATLAIAATITLSHAALATVTPTIGGSSVTIVLDIAQTPPTSQTISYSPTIIVDAAQQYAQVAPVSPSRSMAKPPRQVDTGATLAASTAIAVSYAALTTVTPTIGGSSVTIVLDTNQTPRSAQTLSYSSSIVFASGPDVPAALSFVPSLFPVVIRQPAALITSSQLIFGKAHIGAISTTAQTITGRAKITATTTRTITGIARIQQITNRTITGVAHIVPLMQTRTITGIARIHVPGTGTQTISGVAHIISPAAGVRLTQAVQEWIALPQNQAQLTQALLEWLALPQNQARQTQALLEWIAFPPNTVTATQVVLEVVIGAALPKNNYIAMGNSLMGSSKRFIV